jgi:hypothetical protein
MEIEDLDEIAKKVFEKCMPAKEEIEKSPEKTKFLEAFPGLEYSTIGHILYETIKIALIAGAADIVINKIRHRKEDLENSKEKMEWEAFEVLKKKIRDEKEAKRIAVEISIKNKTAKSGRGLKLPMSRKMENVQGGFNIVNKVFFCGFIPL